MPKLHVYPRGNDAPPAPQAEEPAAPPPAASAAKAEWVIYAEALGVDVAGMSKAQIRKAV